MAEIAFGIPGLVDICIRYGAQIYHFCSAVKHASPELDEKAHLIELNWKRCVEQLKFLKAVSTKGVFDEKYLLIQEKSLTLFKAKVDMAMGDIMKLFKADWIRQSDGEYEMKLLPKPFKYAFKKNSLDALVSALDLWHSRCDPSWYLMLRSNSPALREALRKSPQLSKMNSVSTVRSNIRAAIVFTGSANGIKLEAAAIRKMNVSEIRHSSTFLAVARHSSETTSTYILDRCSVKDPGFERPSKRDVVELSTRLQHEEPETFNLLQCKGYVEDTELDMGTGQEQLTYTIVFYSPKNHYNPKSLRSWLLSGSPPASLSHRFALAKQLAKAVTYIHVFGFVHKNIHPGAIMCFEKANSETPSAFLVGFELFRDEDGKTWRRGDDALDKNLYRHSTRQGVAPESDYSMQHDIYSLGVCMLEIGLWRSFVELGAGHGAYRLSDVFAGYQARHSEREETGKQRLMATARRAFIQLCRKELRSVMGTLYAEIVETCLTCLEWDNTDFGDPDEFQGDDGLRVGYRYIEKVLNRLEGLCV